MTLPNESIVAQFDLQRGAIDYLPETSFGDDLATARAIAAKKEAPFGHLTLQVPGLPSVSIADELLPLASNLGRALKLLRETGKADLDAFSQPFRWQLSREGTVIWVAKDNDSPQAFDAAALESALAACHRRMVAALKQFTPLDPDWERKVSKL